MFQKTSQKLSLLFVAVLTIALTTQVFAQDSETTTPFATEEDMTPTPETSTFTPSYPAEENTNQGSNDYSETSNYPESTD